MIYVIDLTFIFLNINQQWKLMKNDRKTEINTKKLKDKRQYEKNMIVNLLGLILMKKIWISMLKLVNLLNW